MSWLEPADSGREPSIDGKPAGRVDASVLPDGSALVTGTDVVFAWTVPGRPSSVRGDESR